MCKVVYMTTRRHWLLAGYSGVNGEATVGHWVMEHEFSISDEDWQSLLDEVK